MLWNPKRVYQNDAFESEKDLEAAIWEVRETLFGILGTLLTMLNNSVVKSFEGQVGWADGYSLYGVEKRGSIDGYREKR